MTVFLTGGVLTNFILYKLLSGLVCVHLEIFTLKKNAKQERSMLFSLCCFPCYLLNHAKVEDDNYLGQKPKTLNPSLSVAAVKSSFFCQVFQSLLYFTWKFFDNLSL